MNSTSIALGLAGISFLLTVIWGGPLLRILHRLRVGDSIRLEVEHHLVKGGTPTMGGLLFIVPVVVITTVLNAVALLGFKATGRSILLPLVVMVSFGMLGALDDWQKLRQRQVGEGMKARYKLLIQVVFALMIAVVLDQYLGVPDMFIPGLPREIRLEWVYIPIAAFIIVAFANAINFTDGLDGMAGLISATCYAAFGLVALLQGQTYLAQFCFILVGAVFGFLWFNVHPAMLFMGDTGSMALGATLGVVGLMTGQWILLPIIAVIPVSEVVSVVLQVAYFKMTGGQRIFKMSPLHYHFELSGWSETQVVQRFWLVSLLFAMVGVALAVV